MEEIQNLKPIRQKPSFAVKLKSILRNKLLSIGFICLMLVLAFGAGMQYGQQRGSVKVAADDSTKGLSLFDFHNRSVTSQNDKNVDFELFWQVWDKVSASYFDKSAVDSQKMYYGAIQGMVSALGDPYTTFLPPEENKQVKDDLGGNFDGVGMELGFKENRLVVMAPLDDTPAQRAGIQAQDFILKINDEETNGISLPEAVSKIRGPKGTKVTLQIYRTGEDKPRDVELTRDKIHVKSVTYTQKEGKVAYLKVSRFGDETMKEWDIAVDEALKAGSKAVVIDVRNNPGGYMNAAIYMGSEFINGPIMKRESSDGSKQTYNSVRMGKMLNMPVVALINQGSASASEILTGALRAHNRAQLVGVTSFGKGTIQEVEDLDKGAGIHITRARWLMPDDNWVHKKGIEPDVKVEITSDDIKAQKDPQLDKALQLARETAR